MKAVLLLGKRDARIVDLEIPRISREELRVKLLACGICGTDIEKYEGEAITPQVLGHEVVGIIDEVGEGIEEYRKGERVFVHHHVPCRICYFCLRGDFTLCSEFKKVNLDPCGLAEYFRVPSAIVKRGGVFKLSDSISDERATFIEPLACCIRALNKLKPEIGDNVVIFGAGPSGLLHLMLLKELYGTNVAVMEINDLRSKMALDLGAELVLDPRKDVEELFNWSNQRGADIAIVATGNAQAINQALKVLRRGGKLCIFGSPSKNAEITIDPSFIFINEIKILPSYSTTELEIQQAISILEKSRIKPERMITHRFKLEEGIEALETTRKGEAVKTIILA